LATAERYDEVHGPKTDLTYAVVNHHKRGRWNHGRTEKVENAASKIRMS